MKKNLKEIIAKIADINNVYRASSSSARARLDALWRMGDILYQFGVDRPHAIGWAIQEETRGLIKRPTIFRSHKIRSIWHSKEDFLRDLGGIKSISNLTEILPLIDPAQEVRKKLTAEELGDIYRHAASDSPSRFKSFADQLKQEFSHGRLGKKLDKSKHLKKLGLVVQELRTLMESLYKIINSLSEQPRDLFRTKVNILELKAFSNMCIALTTRNNIKLYKKMPPIFSSATDESFKKLYDYFRSMLEMKSDAERARLRRLVSAEALAQVSDMVSSLQTEDAVTDYRARRKMVINL